MCGRLRVALRAHAPLVEEEEAGAFHLAAEARHGRSPGLQAVKSAATGANITDAAGVEAEVLGFYSAIFQGRHSADASDPEDSGTPFSPDPTTFPRFLDGLPRLSPAQRDSLETPFSVPELAAAVLEAAPDKSPGLEASPMSSTAPPSLWLARLSSLPSMPCLLRDSSPSPFAVEWSASYPRSPPSPPPPSFAPLPCLLLTTY
jgi:hypothetical protein